MIRFEWDAHKSRANMRKHGIEFDEAATVFKDPISITSYDPNHSEEEQRFITVGMSTAGHLLLIAHTDRGDRIRIIGARELTRRERQAYEEEIQRRSQ
jgi:uncharacterized DUF497 family protein